MSNWQEWVVALLLLLCIARIGQNIYAFWGRSKEKKNPCANCASGCELRGLYDNKRSKCSDEQKKSKKKCCG